MKIAIIGSRSLNYATIPTVIEEILDLNPETERVITGGAVGVDKIAERVSSERGIPVTVILPDYEAHPGKYAPIIRNKQIADTCDRLFAIWDGKSRGTEFTFRRAAQRVEVTVFKLDSRGFISESETLNYGGNTGKGGSK